MKPTTGIIGLTVIATIFIASFFVYSKLSRSNDSSPSQTATITDFLNNSEPQTPVSDKVAVNSSSSASSDPSLSGFKENELQEGLEGIKAGLDFLKNPIE